MMHERKLRPISCAVAAGVTSNAVTSKAPTTCTILTTTAAVTTLNNNPIARTGNPWILAAIGSIVHANNAGPINNIQISARIQKNAIKSKLSLSINRRFPKR